LTCWRGSKSECSARWIVCDSKLMEEAGDLVDAYREVAVGNVNIRMINGNEKIRYLYVNQRGAGFVLELDAGIFDRDCFSEIKADILDKLTQALYDDPRWQLLYHIIDRQMLPTP